MSVIENLERRVCLSVAVADLGVTASQFSQPVTIGGTTYFNGKTAGYDWELWKTNGTAAGTSRVADIYSGATGSSPSNLTNVNGTLFFTVTGGGLYKSDGTAAGTQLVKSFNGGGVRELVSFNNQLYFAGYTPNDGASDELWKSDGTAAGTQLVKDISPGPYGSSIGELTAWNGKLYFFADSDPGTTSVHGVELFSSDGTAAGTNLLKDINPGTGNSIPEGFVPFNGKLYFSAYTAQSGGELWQTDGTPAGTVMTRDIVPGSGDSNAFPRLVMNNALYVTSGQSNSLAQTLYKIDAAGVFSTVKQFTATNYAAAANDFVPLGNGRMAFLAYDPDHGTEPWISDGTAAGTHIIKDIAAGNTNKGVGTPTMVSLNGYAVFAYDDGTGKLQMFATDGTAAGTAPLATGGAGNYTRYATLGNSLIFNAGSTGDELFAAALTPPVTTGTITGLTYNDLNGNGVQDAGETGRPGIGSPYLDLDRSGAYTAGEPLAGVASDGSFTFSNVTVGTYLLRLQVTSSLSARQTGPVNNGAITVNVVAGQTSGGNAFGAQPLFGVLASAYSDANRNGVHDAGEGLDVLPHTAFADANSNGIFDAGEIALSSTTGSFDLRLPAGSYSIRLIPAAGYAVTTAAAVPIIVSIYGSVTAAGSTSPANPVFGVAPSLTPPVTGTLNGFTFDDANKNGVYDAAELRTSGKTVFLDANGNNALDAGEKSLVTGAAGVWSFAGLAAGTYHARQAFASGTAVSTALIDVTLAAGKTVSGLSIGSKIVALPPAATASISGFIFGDLNRNGVYDSGDTVASGRVVWLDLDDDGVKDANEASATTDSSGKFTFTKLAAGKYHVRRVFPAGYVESTPARYVTVTAGQAVGGVAIGSKSK